MSKHPNCESDRATSISRIQDSGPETCPPWHEHPPDGPAGPNTLSGTFEPTFAIYHPNSWNSYHFPTAKGTVSPMQPSDGMILVIGPRLEGHSVIFLAIQTHLSCRFLLAVDSLGLRRSGSSSQIINQAQDFPEQVPRHRHLSQLERNVAAMSDNLGPDLHQLVAQRRHRPVLHLLRQSQCPHEVAQIVGGVARLVENWRTGVNSGL